MQLPSPTGEGTISVERAIRQRRTIRRFEATALDLRQLSQLLWAASGITDGKGFKRAAPSAGALYPMDIFVAAGDGGVASIDAGVYHYEPQTHRLSAVLAGDRRTSVAAASLSQIWMARAPITLVITAAYDRSTVKYGQRGIRYAMIEAGHIGQNIFLQAQALDLAAGIVGAFREEEIVARMHLPAGREPLLLMPVGYPASQ